MKKTTLELYKELFVTPLDFNDMFFAKHAKMFREKYPDCPRPESLELLEIEVSYDFTNEWKDENGECINATRTLITDDIADQILDRKVLEYIDKHVTDKELRENICSCISPLRPIQQVVFHTEDCFWHCMVRVDQMDTNVAYNNDFWLDAWEEDAYSFDDVYVYFTWDKITNTTMEDVEVDEDYEEQNVVLMRWNPDISNFTKEDYMNLLQAYRKGEPISLSWAVWDYKKVKPGDKVYFLRVGKWPTGIVATGTITDEPYVGEDWSGQGREVHYVDFDVDMMYHPDGYIINLDVLQAMFNEIDWNKGHSGVVIEDNEFKDRLNSAHDDFYNNMYLHRPEKFRDRP